MEKRQRKKRQLTIRLLLYSYLLFYCCTRLLNVRWRWKMEKRWMTRFFQVKFCFQHTGGKQPNTVENQSSPSTTSAKQKTPQASKQGRGHGYTYILGLRYRQWENVRDKNSLTKRNIRTPVSRPSATQWHRMTNHISTVAALVEKAENSHCEWVGIIVLMCFFN